MGPHSCLGQGARANPEPATPSSGPSHPIRPTHAVRAQPACFTALLSLAPVHISVGHQDSPPSSSPSIIGGTWKPIEVDIQSRPHTDPQTLHFNSPRRCPYHNCLAHLRREHCRFSPCLQTPTENSEGCRPDFQKKRVKGKRIMVTTGGSC